MATIRKRGDRWQVIVKRKGYPLQSSTFDLKQDAEKWGRQQERLLDAGQWQDTTQTRQTTLGDLLGRYLSEVTSTKRGRVPEASRIRAFQRSPLAKCSIAALTGQMVASWRDTRQKKVSPGTVSRELCLLGHVLNVASREWGIVLQSNPVSLVRRPPQPAPRDRVLNALQRASLLASCGNCRNPWIKPVVVFALETATRRGEILSLTWMNVDLQRGTAKVDGKTGPRTVPLSPECLAMLQGLPRSLDGQVFPVTVNTFKQAYERAVVKAGIVDFTFHDLRHDALTRLAKQGFNVLELRAISGHTTANMLQRYVSIDAGDLAIRLAATA